MPIETSCACVTLLCRVNEAITAERLLATAAVLLLFMFGICIRNFR